MKNVKYILPVLIVLNTIIIKAQGVDPIDPMGDPGAATIDGGLIVLAVCGLLLIAFSFKNKLIKTN